MYTLAADRFLTVTLPILRLSSEHCVSKVFSSKQFKLHHDVSHQDKVLGDEEKAYGSSNIFWRKSNVCPRDKISA